VALASFACIVGTASAQDFANGNFDGNADGWTLIDTTHGGYMNSAGQDAGTGWVHLNSNASATVPRAEQMVSGFSIGTMYTVSGYIRTQSIFNDGDVFQALVDGGLAYAGPNMALDEWTAFAFDFTATATDHTFTFQAEVTADSDWALDTLGIVVVPAPAGLGVLAAAGLITGIRRRRM